MKSIAISLIGSSIGLTTSFLLTGNHLWLYIALGEQLVVAWYLINLRGK